MIDKCPFPHLILWTQQEPPIRKPRVSVSPANAVWLIPPALVSSRPNEGPSHVASNDPRTTLFPGQSQPGSDWSGPAIALVVAGRTMKQSRMTPHSTAVPWRGMLVDVCGLQRATLDLASRGWLGAQATAIPDLLTALLLETSAGRSAHHRCCGIRVACERGAASTVLLAFGDLIAVEGPTRSRPLVSHQVALGIILARSKSCIRHFPVMAC